jgi:hypothetical protein
MKQINNSPCDDCHVEGCRTGVKCRRWQAWFIPAWREMREMFGVVEDDN